MYVLCNVHACTCMHVHMLVCVPVLYRSTRVSAYMHVLTCAREHACMQACVHQDGSSVYNAGFPEAAFLDPLRSVQFS